jgi:hypothetical protein
MLIWQQIHATIELAEEMSSIGPMLSLVKVHVDMGLNASTIVLLNSRRQQTGNPVLGGITGSSCSWQKSRL